VRTFVERLRGFGILRIAVSIGALWPANGQARPTNYEECMQKCVPSNDDAVKRGLTEVQLAGEIAGCDLTCDPLAIAFDGGPLDASATYIALFDDLTHFSYELSDTVGLFNNVTSLALASQGTSFVEIYERAGHLFMLDTPTRFVGFAFDGGPRQSFEMSSLVLYDEQQNVLELLMLLDTPYDVLADRTFFDQSIPFLGIETKSPVKYVRTFQMQIYPVPEPGSLAMSVAGLMVASCWCRRPGLTPMAA
jgi:hypothetical protein